jgi:uncharacterized membrane protein HdeD (DUF308 family)
MHAMQRPTPHRCAKLEETTMATIGQTSPHGLRPATEMVRNLAENWWLILLRGIAALLFGILAFVWPGLTLLVLVALYGAYALIDGVLSIGSAVMGPGTAGSRIWLVVIGLLGIGAGLLTFFWPALTALVLAIFIGAWALATGIVEIIGAIRLRKEIDNEWLLALSGLVSVIFGLLILFYPGAGALALVWAIATYAIIFGILMIAFSFRVKGYRHAHA